MRAEECFENKTAVSCGSVRWPARRPPRDGQRHNNNEKKMAVRYFTDDCTYRLPQSASRHDGCNEVAARGGLRAGRRHLYFLLSAAAAGDEPPIPRARLLHRRHHVRLQRPQRRARIVSGDIFIDVETVADNARQYGATTLQEMRRVVVHGCCTSAGRATKRPAPMHRCTERRTNT